MGVEVKSKKIDGILKYQLRSTISNELYHKEDWVDLETAKKTLMETKIWNFFESLVQIDMEFPNFYHVNGKAPKAFTDKTCKKFASYAIENYFGKGGGMKLNDDVNSIIKRLNLDIIDKPEIKFGLYLHHLSDSELPDTSKLIAISDSREKLQLYCQTTYNKEIGKPQVFSCDDYFTIEPYKPLTIL